MARHQRLGKGEEQIVDVVALLGAHFENVAEARRRDQPEPGAAPLDDGVGHQRRAVNDLADIGERDARSLRQFIEADERCFRGVVRRGQALVQTHACPRLRSAE